MNMQHIFNQFRIQKKILLCILPVVIISYVYFLFCFNYIINQSKKQLLDTNEKKIMQITESVDDYFTQLSLNIDLLLYSTEIPDLLSGQETSDFALEEQANAFITYLTDTNSKIQRVYFFSDDNYMIANNATYSSTYRLYTEKLPEIQYALTHSTQKIGLFFYQSDNRIITVAKNIYNVNNPLQIMGTVIIEIDSNFFDNIVSAYTTSDTFFSLLNQERNILRTTSKLSYDDLEQMIFRYHSTFENDKYYSIRYQSSTSVLQVCGTINTSQQFKVLNQMLLMIVLFTILFFILICFFIIRITRMISSQFRKFIDILNNTHSLEDSQLVSCNTRDEFAELATVYNEMLVRLDNANTQMLSQKMLVKNAELKALQAQINPHFLYNTLDCISSLASMGKTKTIEDIVPKLANIMRMSIKGPDFLKIKDDISFIRQYLDIQELRFSDAYLFLIEVDSELDEYYIPKLILQPIVENSILHGISKSVQGGVVIIRGCLEDESVLFKISNSGGLFPEDILHQINSFSEKDTYATESIGLLNIQARVRNLFGASYGLTLQNVPDRGVHVYLKLPILLTPNE